MSQEWGEIDCKRFYIPDTNVTCPQCEHETTLHEYLSYPIPNKPFTDGAWCPECGHGWEVECILNVSLEVLNKEDT